jgi:L-ascorbate metabolism protein UlaG (beta-lactamase superfamily)
VPLTPHEPPPPSVAEGRAAITFIGHSTFLIRTSAGACITDPVFTTHAGPFGRLGPRRVRAPGVPLASLPPIDGMLVTHKHYDHLQPSSQRSIAARGAPWTVTSLGLAGFLSRQGLPDVRELDWWQATDVSGFGRVTAVPAQHFSARTPWDRDRTLWSGFVIESGGLVIYFAGDTGYTPALAEIGRRFPRIDLALIPIGAYEPRWFMEPVHVDPAGAMRIHVEIAPRRSFGMHFGTFQLTDEPIDDPIEELAIARAAWGVCEDAFHVIDFGETAIV